MAIPDGYYGRVAPRSGLAVKYGVDVLAGVVDSGYRGEIIVILTRCASDDGFEEALTFPIGSKIAQLIIERVDDCQMVEAENLPTSDRGMNGFGSSGV